MAGFLDFVRRLFENNVLVAISAIGAFFWRLLFPQSEHLYAAGAVFGVMILDLLTKLYALSKRYGGFRAAFRVRKINSRDFGTGTINKLLLFGIMVIVCGLAYRLPLVSGISEFFLSVVMTILFLKDVISIVENLSDAGVSGLGIFKRILKRKLEDIAPTEEEKTDV